MIIKSNGFLEEYYEKAKSGEVVIGQELKIELENLIEDMESDRYNYDTADADERIDFIENCVRLTKSPFYGKPMILMLFQKAYISALYGFKMPDGKDRFKKSIFLLSRKNGKALALDTRIPTPSGDRTIADIQAGDMVFDENGKPIRVLATSEIFKDRPCYKITFEDGEEIICDENHKWTVQTKGCRRRQKYVRTSNRKARLDIPPIDEYACMTLYTHQIVDDYARPRKDGKGTDYKYRVPVPGAVEYSEKDLFNPYILGLWLGDGDKNDNRLTCGADDLDQLLELLDAEGVYHTEKMYSGKYEVRLGKRIKHSNAIKDKLRELNVYKNKHIPEEDFYGSIEQRMALLQGLMDTDGFCSKAGQCEFAQKNERLTKDVSRLLTSLGIKHTVFHYDNIKCGDAICEANEIRFWVDKASTCFRYRRKTERLKDHLAPRMNFKSIVKIERVENRDTKCITVDNPRGLFLCGNRNTVTHNSELCSALGLAEFILGKEGADIVCSSNDDIQASILYDAMDLMRQMIDPRDLDSKKNQRFILNKITNTKIFKMSERTRNKEGRNIDIAFQDESHELKENTIPKSIEQSQSLKENPKFINITTEGFVNDGYLDKELKRARSIIMGEATDVAAERYLPWLYTQDSELEVWSGDRQNRLWMKSNPTLGTVKKWEYLEEQVSIARASKADRIFVLSKDFNLKTNAAEAWLNLEDYSYDNAYDLEEFRDAKCIGAVDLSETTDLTCAKVLLMRENDNKKYILSQYFIPESKLEDSDDKGAGAKYREWAKAGYLTITEGNDIDLSLVADWFYSLYTKYNIRLWKCGYDQRFAKDWLNQMSSYGWEKTGGDDSDLIMILQNAQTLSNAIKLCEADFKHKLIYYNNNEMDKWCLGNAGIQVDNKGQALIVKMETGKRIDGAVCLAILYEMYRRYRSNLRTLIGG